MSDDIPTTKNQLANKLKAIVEDDWNIPTTPEEDEAVYRQLIRAQEGPMRRFWEETKNENL